MLAVRNLEKGKAAADLITRATPGASVAVQELDLTSLDSVRAAADQLRAKYASIDLLINNAGVMFTPKVDHQGRLRIAVRHQPSGPFRVHQPAARSRAGGAGFARGDGQQHRPSLRPRGIRFDDLQWENGYSRVGAYGQAKLANLLFTYELQRRLQGTDTIAVAAHPGGSRTELTRNLPPLVGAATRLVEPLFQSADMGALPTLRAATDPGVLGGQYFGPDGFGEQRGYPKVVASSVASHDTEAQRRLWTVSEELTAVVAPVG